MSEIGIIIATFNNNQYLYPLLRSILNTGTKDELFHIYLVNNGDAVHMQGFPPDERLTILQQDHNLGWEGGLKVGLKESKEPLVVLLNDDTHIPFTSKNWLRDMAKHFYDPKVGAVGPITNVVMGGQNCFIEFPMTDNILRSKFLVNFCCMVRRSALDEVGGVDDTLPGGDDLDQSIRLRKGGYELLIDRNVFVYHHGFKTGERVNGPHQQAGGWNSVEMVEKTNFALIRKHGLRTWMDVTQDQILGVYGLQQA